MSLPHASASRRTADDPGGAALRRWRRPYPIGPYRVGLSASLLVLVTYLLIAAGVEALAGDRPGALGMLGATAVLTAVALRLLRVGVWVGGGGVRTVGLLRTSTVSWDRIASVRTAQQPVRWLSLPRTVQGQALEVRRTDGEVLPVLLTDRGPDFLGRADRFALAAEAIRGRQELSRPGW